MWVRKMALFIWVILSSEACQSKSDTVILMHEKDQVGVVTRFPSRFHPFSNLREGLFIYVLLLVQRVCISSKGSPIFPRIV